ncbi:hypothetical protein HCB40_04110 [Listeria welshimeri]|nr:hypothetical protein [Listeria welshimeri]MBC1348326.1 hypothetical protein [Listeria welshimeri]MBC1612903.1 hypothetical protein [Listeria welshimeri]MBC2274066.1 hypothetical protein [Listeria welshimeri]MBC2302244.1 hypothetical protein [Listeria welshimeri]
MSNKFNEIGHVSTEGGPILIGDYKVITKWNGIDTDDYDKLIETPEEDFMYKIADKTVGVWNPEGGSFIGIHSNHQDEFTFIKSYTKYEEDYKYIGAVGRNEEIIGDVEIFSNTLLILYAPESGVLLEPLKENSITRLKGDLAFEESVLSIPVTNGTYRLVSDFVFGSETLHQAKRLVITKL